MVIRGKAHKYGEDVNTDLIIPGRYLNIADAYELGKHCMEDFDPEFRTRVKTGDVIVARKNFGCGSSREHAPISIKSNGISCIIADSFARIFYRNAINLALPLIECQEIAMVTEMGDEIEVNIKKGIAINHTKRKTSKFIPYPKFLMDILDAGGLIEYTRKTI